MDNAHLPKPQGQWGYIVLEQEGSSVLKRSDEVSPSQTVDNQQKADCDSLELVILLHSTMPSSKARKVFPAILKMLEA
jgi:hypothetical protein